MKNSGREKKKGTPEFFSYIRAILFKRIMFHLHPNFLNLLGKSNKHPKDKEIYDLQHLPIMGPILNSRKRGVGPIREGVSGAPAH